MSTDVLYSLFYLLLCLCIIYPPDEFLSAGFTVPDLFSSLLGSESEQFIFYHIKRSSLTICIYSLLPLGYTLGSIVFSSNNDIILLDLNHSFLWKAFVSTAFILPITAACIVYFWFKDSWNDHPIAKNLSRFGNNNSDWKTVAASINDEYRRIDKICIQANPISKVIATENWIMKVTAIYIHIAHQSDASLVVCQSDTHELSPDDVGETQFINIEVSSTQLRFQPFVIRINTNHFRTLQDRIARMITVLPNVKFHKNLMDKFTDAFKDAIKDNPRYVPEQEVENCMACMQTPANVKLQKMCSNNVHGADQNCQTCYCRPMWCSDCMAKWFAAKLEEENRETWLSSKCTCPMCRATFCVLDVCLIEEEEHA